MYDPLINYWSFRFEGKHAYFKDLASRMKCRKNVLLTLAKKHQYYHCWQLQRHGPYLHSEQAVSRGEMQVPVCVLPIHVQAVLKPLIADSETIFQANSVDFDGIKYDCDLAVITGMNNCELCFSQICALFIINCKLVTVACRLEEQQYLRHFHMYSCAPSNVYHVLSPAELLDPVLKIQRDWDNPYGLSQSRCIFKTGGDIVEDGDVVNEDHSSNAAEVLLSLVSRR